MGVQLIDPATGKVVTITEHLYPFRGDTETVQASDTFENVLGYGLELNVGGVVVINVGIRDLRVQFTGSAASASSGITLTPGDSETFFGGKADLDNYRLFSEAPGTSVSIEQLTSPRGR